MSRLDKLKEQHPELNISIIDIIGMIDPTDTYKYSEFLIKILKRWYDNLDIRYGMGVDFIGEENVEILNEFEKHCKAKRIEKNDISQHSDFISLKNEVKKAN
jgi:histidinol phosphatase-like PHP family hydrolase